MPEPGKDTYTLSSGEAAKAELRELRELAEEMAAAIRGLVWNAENGYDERSALIVERESFKRLGRACARYEALRDG